MTRPDDHSLDGGGRDDRVGDPADRVTLDESLQRLLTVTLATLSPAERMAFVLHDVFGVRYGTVADVVGRTADETRALTRSARRRVHHHSGSTADASDQRRLLSALDRACADGDEERLMSLLDSEVTVVTDGGGRAGRPLGTASGVIGAARLLIDLYAQRPPLRSAEQSVNGESGLLLRRHDEVVGVLALAVHRGKITEVWLVVNPDKLRQWNAGGA